MYSLNVPVPAEIERLAEDLRPALLALDTIRERHSLVCKRLDDESSGEGRGGGGGHTDGGSSRAARRADVPRLRERVRTALAGAPAFEARVTSIDCFERPPRGEGPVVYLAVESPGLRRVHDRLLPEFSAVKAFEGDDYVPHVTLARGGDVTAARRLTDREIAPVTWTVDRLDLWDARYEESVAEFALPA